MEKTVKDSTLPLTERPYRLEVVEEFLKAGMLMVKIDSLRPLLEKNGHPLPASSHLGQYISIICKLEIEKIKEELALPGHA